MVFVVTGSSAFVGAGLVRPYRPPHDFPGTNAAEIDQIRRGGGLVDLGRPRRAPPLLGRRPRIRSRRESCGGCTSVSSPHFDALVLPHLVPDVPRAGARDELREGGVPCVTALPGRVRRRAELGLLSDVMVRRGASLGTARKTRSSPVSCSRPASSERTSLNSPRRSSASSRWRSSATDSRPSPGRWCRPLPPSACSGSPAGCSTSLATCPASPCRS